MLALCAALTAGCDGSNGDHGAAIGQESDVAMTRSIDNQDLAADLRRLSEGRVYFGHMSVGYNMMSGLQRIAEGYGEDGLNLIDLTEASGKVLPPTFFAHSTVGENSRPRTKLDEFAHRLRSDLAGEVDVAFIKFCYVDFNPSTDVQALFESYQSTLGELSDELPEMRLVHTTVPLHERRLRIRDHVRLLLGMPVWRDEANVRRSEFNALLHQTFDGRDIIDIALVESTNPDGTRQQFARDGQLYPSLSSAYTTDGGHLNEAGQHEVASEMVRVLARRLEPRNEP